MPPVSAALSTGRKNDHANQQTGLRSIIPDEARLLFAEQIPAEYLSDALGRRTGTADALVFALSTEEVSGVLRYANENGIPVTPRGDQSGRLDDSAVRWYHSGCISHEPRARARPRYHDRDRGAGHPAGSDFQSYVEERGLFYPPDPGEKASSIGGNVITERGWHACGQYGVTRDYVRGSGGRLRTARC